MCFKICLFCGIFGLINIYALSSFVTMVLLVILAPTIPKEDDLPIIPEPEPSTSVPEKPTTTKPLPTGTTSLE